MSFIENFQSQNKEEAQLELFSMLNNKAMDALSEIQLDELSSGTLGNYTRKASDKKYQLNKEIDNLQRGIRDAGYSGDKDAAREFSHYRNIANTKLDKHKAGVDKAIDRLTKESEELSTDEVASLLAEYAASKAE